MKKILTVLFAMANLVSCSEGIKDNPLLSNFDTTFGVPPFDKIKTEHYMPAFGQALREARAEVEAIAGSNQAPTFENTIEAMERSGKRLDIVSTIFFNLNHSATDSVMDGIALEVSPMLTEFGNDVSLNPELFKRVKAVYDKKDALKLTPEQTTLLDNTYKSFVRSGANLGEREKAEYREISTELSNLTLVFGQNVLAATNAWHLHITDSADLAGLPPFVVDGAAQEAKARNLDGWAITLQAPSMTPFMQYSERRELREKIWKEYNRRCVGGRFDNTAAIKRITELRLRAANLLGYPTFADYVLEERMAETSSAVNDFLSRLADRAMPYARKDYDMIDSYARLSGLDSPVQSWDWSYYSEKYKDEHYGINDETTRPYFKLENVEKGVFLLANKLYGIKFTENTSIPVYHPDVRAFEVHDTDGTFLAVLYIDYFPRDSKNGGAWMTSYRGQYMDGDKNIRPVISLVCNFTKPTATTPSLLTFWEVETLLHEFGHALHGIFASGTYKSLSGTSTRRDFVELPSQIMENWLKEKEYLDLWAVHYQTGEPIPAQMVENIRAAQNYLSGFMNSRQISYGITDMAWHSITAPITEEAVLFEKRQMDRTRVIPYVAGTAMSPAFNHIFAGGYDYAAGYYGYKWAEVLDADAFAYFRETGIFNRETAARFREHVLSKGGSEPPMELYIRFRGKEPSTDAFFERAGLTE